MPPEIVSTDTGTVPPQTTLAENGVTEIELTPEEDKARRKQRLENLRAKQEAKRRTSDVSAEPRDTRVVDARVDPDEDGRPGVQKLTKPLQDLQNKEDLALRDYCVDLGIDNGAVRIDIFRSEPDRVIDPKTGKPIKTNGHLESVRQLIDENYIAERHGGGTYKVKINRPGPDGKYHYFKTKEIHIGGEPRVDFLPKNVVAPEVAAAATVPVASAETSPTIVRDAFSFMRDQVERANERAERTTGPTGPQAPDPATMVLVETLKAQIAQQAEDNRQLRQELLAAHNKPMSKEDAFKDGLVKQLLDGDSTRLQAVRMQYESELRMAKEDASKLETRLRDSFERERQRIEDSHTREISLIKQSHETTLASLKLSFDTSKQVLEAQISALKRENETMRDDMKELRAKKEKSPLELAKEFETYQEVFGKGESDETTADKLIGALPQVMEGVQGIINRNKPAPAPAQQPAAPVLMRDPAGNVFQVRGKELIPVRKKGQRVQVAAAEGQPPQEVEIPAIDPQALQMAVGYLETAFSKGQDPEVVAVSARAATPPEILTSIRDLGIDVFLSKVAKLPSASPLATQAGKNWTRKIGKALVGE